MMLLPHEARPPAYLGSSDETALFGSLIGQKGFRWDHIVGKSSKTWMGRGRWGAQSQQCPVGTSSATDLLWGGAGGERGTALGFMLILCPRRALSLDLLSSKVLPVQASVRLRHLSAAFFRGLCSFHAHCFGICLEFYLFSTRFNFNAR